MIGIPTDRRWPLSKLIVGAGLFFFYQASQTNVPFPCERSNVEEYVDGFQRDASA